MLDLRYSGVTNAGVRALRAALPKCKVTYVGATPTVSDASAAPAPAGKSQQALARWIQALGGQVRIAEGRIQAVSLVRVPFTDGQLKHLAALHGLEKLNLEATDLSDAGLESLAKLTGLRELNLSFTSVSDRGLVFLAPLAAMRRLALAGTRVTGRGLSHLAGWAALKEFDLTKLRTMAKSYRTIFRMFLTGNAQDNLLKALPSELGPFRGGRGCGRTVRPGSGR